MKYLQVFAGQAALKTIKQQGFNQGLFSTMLGASGGPKWFCLYGLDRYLFSEFFAQRQQPLNLLGSSAGAYRFAALAQTDPVAAIERLADFYSHVTYSSKPSSAAVCATAYDVLDYVLGEQGAAQIITNPIIKAHFIVAKTNGLLAHDSRFRQLCGLSRSYLLNRLGRDKLARQYHRYIFSQPSQQVLIDDPHALPTHYVNLTVGNLKQALYASGAIPLVMDGINEIENLPKGTYRDGGIIDYHFDFTVKAAPDQGPLVLYPHFNSQPKAGWFDKNLKRQPLASSYDKVVMLAPTQEFIEKLPYQKIPDRKDFKQLSDRERINYWQQVLELSQLLADDFKEFVASQSLEKIASVNFTQN